MNKTVVAVCIFIVLLVCATYSAYGVESGNGARVSLGHSVLNSRVTVGELSYERNGWEVAASQMGQGWTKRGEQLETKIYSFSHVVRPSWYFLGGRNYFRIGASYVDGSPLVGDTNYRLGVGLEHKLIAVEFFHYSSAGIHKPNTGLDGVLLRLKIPANR